MIRIPNVHNKDKRQGGFTLIEILVVAAITIAISSFLFLNFSSSRTDVDRVVVSVVADIRASQAEAAGSVKYLSKYRCGYGIHYVNATSYTRYAGPDASTTTCSTQNRNYTGADVVMRTMIVPDAKVQIKAAFTDIFFEPPRPTTFVNNSSTSLAADQILIGPTSADCATTPASCRAVCVYTSGRIEQPAGTLVCP